MTTSARVALFEVAANPDPDSTLPFLIRLPLSGGELVLKARDSWPRTAKVYCHRADGWPDDPEIVERIPVRSCQRRGVAIDLVLDRPRENRSQLVFTRIQGGREGIFWQSARTTRQARPGIRVPRRRAADLAHLTILVDSRERYPYKFAQQQASTQRRALPAGDYGIAHDDQIVAVVERKSLHDLVRRLIDGQLTYALADIAALPRAAVVVEDRYSNLFKLDFAKPGFVTELLAALTVRYPTVPIHFAETRPLGRGMDILGSSAPRSPTTKPRTPDQRNRAPRRFLSRPGCNAQRTRSTQEAPCPDQDATIPAPAAPVARSNAAAESTAGPARTISRARTSPTKRRDAARKLRHLDDDQLRDCSTTCSSYPSSTSR